MRGSQFVGLSGTEVDILSYEVALAIFARVVSRSNDSSGDEMNVLLLAKRKEDRTIGVRLRNAGEQRRFAAQDA